ncbi:LysR family transcriptional regulator [Serratia aquatilis]|uniref:LysR family transcriptional regulator n=1 Tax=Serratia aquatilis TaxID=1737515 RepID=A0ABV6E7Y9_9GAMM
MKNELQGIKAFVKIAQTGCFTKAAHMLNITQSALTRRIKKLEENLGKPLFERTTRKVTLTRTGEKLLPNAKNLIDIFESSLLNIEELATYQTGTITLSCVPTATFYFLPDVIKTFNAKYPNISIRILEHSAYDCLETVLSGDADFGINMNNVTNANIEFTPLVSEPFVVACRRDHPLSQQKLVSWQELLKHKLIGVRRSSGNRLLIEGELLKIGLQPEWFYEVRHLSTSLGLVEAGLGIAALPSLAMPKHDHPILVSKPLVEPVIRRTLGLVKRRDSPLSPAANSFVELLLTLWNQEEHHPWSERFHL